MPAFPDMTGKKLPTEMDVMRHMAHLRQFRPKTPVYDLALETCDVAAVYWKMGKIPVQELSGSKSKIYRGADRLANLWQEYQVRMDTLHLLNIFSRKYYLIYFLFRF